MISFMISDEPACRCASKARIGEDVVAILVFHHVAGSLAVQLHARSTIFPFDFRG